MKKRVDPSFLHRLAGNIDRKKMDPAVLRSLRVKFWEDDGLAQKAEKVLAVTKESLEGLKKP